MQSFKSCSSTLYGERTVQCVREYKRTSIKRSKHINHLAFLKRCRDTSIIPPGLRLHDPIRNHRSNHILLAASQALLRERISSTGCTLKLLDRQITASETALKSSLQQRDFDKISSFTQSSSLHAFKSSC